MIGNASGAKRGRWLPASWVRAALSGHAALGLAVSALLYLICLTGTLAVFADELERWEQPGAPVVHTIAAGALDRGLSEGLSRAAAANRQSITLTLPSPSLPRLAISAGGHDGSGGETWLADRDGTIIVPASHRATDLIVALHVSLHCPDVIGRLLVGLLGIAMLALLGSGVAAHPRMFKDAFRLRRGGHERSERADLHNRLGTWGLPFHMMIAATGAMLGLFFTIFAILAASAYNGDLKAAFADTVGAQDTVHVAGPATLPTLDPIVAQVRGLAPRATIRSVSVERAGSQGQHVTVRVEEPGDLSLFQVYRFDGAANLISTPHSRPRSVGGYLLTILQPLHFGWFGGVAVKLLYGVFGLILSIITAEGVSIWLIKRRDRGNPTPSLEKLWTAIVWGQPAALASAALSTLVWSGSGAAGWGWSVAFAASCVLATLVTSNKVLTGTLRWLTVLAMALLVLGDLLRIPLAMSTISEQMFDMLLIIMISIICTINLK